jgi:hypothetical protein
MKQRNFTGRVLATGLAVLFMAAAPLALAEKYDGVTVTFEKPVVEVQKAAVDALTTVGAAPSKQEPNFVEGKRKNKVGLMVGSGGEVLSVALTSLEEGKTQAKVRTTKTFVGRAGQKVWDQQILEEMSKVLGVAPPAAPVAPASAAVQ